MASNRAPSGAELLGIIEMIHREKEIDKEILFQGLENAILTAARRKFGDSETLVVTIDRQTGELTAADDNQPIDASDLGRIAAQTAKQVFIQRMREAESDILYREFITKREHILFGTVKRFEAGAMIVDLGKAEGYIPRSEQVRSEHYHPGDRIRAYVSNVEKLGPKLRISMSRTHPNLVYCLFELEVPEVAEGVIEIVNLVREPGYRTKMLVRSHDPKVDSIGACLGVRGSRINSIRDEIGGEKVDIIPFTDDLERLVVEALKPAEVRRVEIDFALNRARVHVDEDFLSLAIGRKGLNVRLAARLCGLSINIVTTDTATQEEQLEYQVETEPEAGEEDAVKEEAVEAEVVPDEEIAPDDPGTGAAVPPEEDVAPGAETT
ncbi:MAG: transcription termination factor NusA [Planctomycetes bacterium]|nr:transcription termination factor NusA [Planctomycetota bacterium]